MKILYLSATNTAEAGNRVLLTWIDYLSPKGYVIAACCPAGGTLSYQLSKRLGKRFCSLPFFVKGSRAFFSFLKLFLFACRFRPDIIHCNTEISYYIARYVSLLLRIPVIVHVRFHYAPSFYAWLFKKRFMPTFVLFVSNALLKEELNKVVPVVPSSRLGVLHNCLSLKNVSLSRLSFSADFMSVKSVFGCYGPIQKRKGQHHLLFLADKLKKAGMSSLILVAGRIREQDYYDYCIQLENDLQVHEYIKFLGHVNDIFSLLKSTCLTISVSEYETFGMSVLESMALGVPVISFFVPALEEIIGDAGVIVPQGDIDSLFDACREISQNFSLRQDLADRCRQRFVQKFTPEVIVPQLEKFYYKARELGK